MQKKTFILILSTILLQSFSLFTDSVEIVCRINSNKPKHVLFEKGDYLLLEKFTTQYQPDVMLNVNTNAIIISKASSKESKHIISGESIIMTIENEKYLLKNKFTLTNSNEYLVSTLKVEDGSEYLIVKNKLEI